MFKKTVHIIMIVLLLFSTTGVTFYKHYCGNSLISESIGHEPKKCCGDACKACHNESKTYKLSENYEANDNIPALKAGLKNIFVNIPLSFVLSFTITDPYRDKNLLSRYQIIDISPFLTGDYFALLQVFRL
jgi:hypothetical protein